LAVRELAIIVGIIDSIKFYSCAVKVAWKCLISFFIRRRILMLKDLETTLSTTSTSWVTFRVYNGKINN
jgi:hypothetical protein